VSVLTPVRRAGLMYLVVVLTGVFALAYVPSSMGFGGDSWENALLISLDPGRYRLGLLGLLVNQIAFLLLPLLLWRLLHRHGEGAAVAMVALAVAGVPVVLSAIGLRLDATDLVAGWSGEMPPDAARRAAAAALDAARNRMLLAMTFWGLWLFPLGLLVWRSRVAPRVLAVLLMLGCVGYLLQVVAGFVRFEFGSPWDGLVSLPASLGEIGFCLWLVIAGGRMKGRA
jgi:hypothetical protein